MKLVIDIPEEDYNGICHLTNAQLQMLPEEVSETLIRIANGTPHETVTEFADRCGECGSSIVGKHVKVVLDKIRAEVEAIERYGTNNGKDIWLRIPEEIKEEVLTIIDKYKVESEGRNG